jgi:hypothetical protein
MQLAVRDGDLKSASIASHLGMAAGNPAAPTIHFGWQIADCRSVVRPVYPFSCEASFPLSLRAFV